MHQFFCRMAANLSLLAWDLPSRCWSTAYGHHFAVSWCNKIHFKRTGSLDL